MLLCDSEYDACPAFPEVLIGGRLPVTVDELPYGGMLLSTGEAMGLRVTSVRVCFISRPMVVQLCECMLRIHEKEQESS